MVRGITRSVTGRTGGSILEWWQMRWTNDVAARFGNALGLRNVAKLHTELSRIRNTWVGRIWLDHQKEDRDDRSPGSLAILEAQSRFPKEPIPEP